MAPVVSVVIPSWQGRHLLGPCLESIAAGGGPEHEIVVVDNGSTDGTAAWLGAAWPGVRVVSLPDNRGYAAACNAGSAVAGGRVVIFLNNDVAVQPGWSAALVAAIDAAPDVVIAGGVSVRADRPAVVDTAGITVAPSFAGVDAGMERPVAEIDHTERDVAAVSGVALAAERDWLAGTGGFEESFFMYYEDLELCLRAWVEGRRVRLVPRSVVHHAGGASAGGREAPFRHYHTTRNRLLSAAKLLEPHEAARAWALSLASDLATVALHALRGRPRTAARVGAAKGRGAASAVAGLGEIAPRRRRLAQRRQRSTGDLRALGLLSDLRAALREFRRLRALLR